MYTFTFDFNNDYSNLTFENLSNEYIADTSEFIEWFTADCDLSNYSETIDNDTEFNDLSIEIQNDIIEDFKDTEYYYSIQDEYIPVFNEVHFLQNKPTVKQIQLINKIMPRLSILYINSLDAYVISLNSAGSDFSEYIELAYYIIDTISPFKSHEIYLLSDKYKKILLEFREKKVLTNSIIQNMFKD